MPFELWFSGRPHPQLERTCFHSPISNQKLSSVRGKTAGAFDRAGVFQWTAAVQAMSVVVLNARAAFLLGTENRGDDCGALSGEKGSPAASLDYAISKQPVWLCEMFGVDAGGNAIAKRIFRRTNPECKRPGPVVVALNPRILPPDAITVYFDEKPAETGDEINELMRLITAQFERPPSFDRRADGSLLTPLVRGVPSRRIEHDASPEYLKEDARGFLQCLHPGDLLLQLLLLEQMLTVRQISELMQARFNISCSEEQLKQVLEPLLKMAIVEKQNGGFGLGARWIESNLALLGEIENINVAGLQDTPRNDVKVNTSPLRACIEFKRLGDMDQYLPHLHNHCLQHVSPGQTVCWHLLHSWWPLFRPVREYDSARLFPHYSSISYVSPSSTNIDKWVAGFYKNVGVKSRIGVNSHFDDDFWVMGDMIVWQAFPQKLKDEIDAFMRSFKDVADFDSVGFFKMFFHESLPLRAQILVAPFTAGALRYRMMSHTHLKNE